MIIGIDFSITSTGICIEEYGKYKWISVTNNIKWDNKPFIHHKAINALDGCEVVSYLRTHIPKKTSMTNDAVQTYKMNNSVLHSKIIMRRLGGAIDKPYIGFEGFSYGSKGNSFIDLIVYNTWLKKSLTDEYVDPPHVVPPKSLKKWATGNGNAGKMDMWQAFLDAEDLMLKEDSFHQYCKSIEIGEDVPKPIEDMVDAYWVCRFMREESDKVESCSNP